jgi:hypothetical protein
MMINGALVPMLPGEVSFSLWLLHVLYRVQRLVWAVCGVGRGGSASRPARS